MLPRDYARDLTVAARLGDFPGFHIDPLELNDIIEEHGISCELRRSVPCPCTRPETGAARSGCTHCNGLRFTYPESLREPAMVLLTNRMPERDHTPAGELVTGQGTATFPLGIHPTEGDIILPSIERHIVSETFWRAAQEIDSRAVRQQLTAPDQLIPRMRPRQEQLLYRDGVDLQAVHWIRSEDDKLVNAAIGADVQVTRDGRIVWVSDDRAPKAGAAYVVRYSAPAAYMIAGSDPVFRSENDNGFPYRCPVVRLDRWDEIDFR